MLERDNTWPREFIGRLSMARDGHGNTAAEGRSSWTEDALHEANRVDFSAVSVRHGFPGVTAMTP
jgi:hypothetical protein